MPSLLLIWAIGLKDLETWARLQLGSQPIRFLPVLQTGARYENCWIAEREGQNVGCVFLVATGVLCHSALHLWLKPTSVLAFWGLAAA
jgi:hypothetical protein